MLKVLDQVEQACRNMIITMSLHACTTALAAYKAVTSEILMSMNEWLTVYPYSHNVNVQGKSYLEA